MFGVLRVYVYDTASTLPLASALVRTSDGVFQGTSDTEGIVNFNVLGGRRYVMEASKLGYDPTSAESPLVAQDTVTQMFLYLTPTGGNGGQQLQVNFATVMNTKHRLSGVSLLVQNDMNDAGGYTDKQGLLPLLLNATDQPFTISVFAPGIKQPSALFPEIIPFVDFTLQMPLTQGPYTVWCEQGVIVQGAPPNPPDPNGNGNGFQWQTIVALGLIAIIVVGVAKITD